MDIVNNVLSFHTGLQILLNDPTLQILSIEPVLLETTNSNQEHKPVIMDFCKTENSEKMK